MRRDHGPDVANQVARRLVIAPHREGGQAQFVERPVGRRENDALSKVIGAMQRRLASPQPIAALAALLASGAELTAAVLEIAKSETQVLVRRIETCGFHVVGDLNDLTSSTASAPTGTGVDISPEELLDAAAVAVAALAERSWARGVRLQTYEAPRRFSRARRVLRRGRRQLHR